MGNNLTMRIKDTMLDLLSIYEHAEASLGFETDVKRASGEISEHAVRRYSDLVKMGKRQPFADEAKAEIAMIVEDAAKLAKDPWAPCRTPNDRIRMAYAITRIIEGKAGVRHDFSVWSCTVYNASPLLKKFKSEGHRGVRLLIAAPSKKKAVEIINTVLGGRETVSWANDHWSGGGTVGEKVATKIGIWAGPDNYNREEDFKLVWEPK